MATRKKKAVEPNPFLDDAPVAQTAAAVVPVWEKGMNPEQLEIIRHTDGPLCNYATAGCHRAGQLVMRWDGTLAKVEDVRVGDDLMGPDGRPRHVVELHRGTGVMYEVRPVKGDPWVVNEDHVLTLVETTSGEVTDVSVRDFLGMGKPYDGGPGKLHGGWRGGGDAWRQNRKLFRVGVKRFGHEDPGNPRLHVWPSALVGPYMLGVFLGDGSIKKSAEVCTADPEVAEEVCEFAGYHGLEVRVYPAGGTSKTYALTPGNGPGLGPDRNPVIVGLRALGLFGCGSGEKFIPSDCLVVERDERLELLAGLIDTDGSLTNGCVDYITKSEQLAADVVFLARSLGLAAYSNRCEKYDQNGRGGYYHRVSISGNVAEIPCRVPRKQAAPRQQKKDVLRTGFTLARLPELEQYFGFSLDGDQRYLLGDFTVTHNSGKTRALVHRIARMVADGIPAHTILAVTFSKKAADEMNTRLGDLGVGDCRVGTWHSLCLQILREDETPWATWRIDEDDRAKVILKEAVGYKHLDWKQADVTKLRQAIGVCKANLAEPMSPEAEWVMQSRFVGSDVQMAMRAYDIFQRLVEERGLLTFDDMMLCVHRHFSVDDPSRGHDAEASRRCWAAKWGYLMVDECLVGDTPVLLDEAGAAMTIREMVERRYAGNVLAYDRSNARSVPRKVYGWHKIALDRPMLRITVRRMGFKQDGTRLGPLTEKVRYRSHFVACTVDHLVWTPYGWKRADALAVGDEVVVETSARLDGGYSNRMKVGAKGRAKLAREMALKNEAGRCGASCVGNARGPKVRGGNGGGLTAPEEALLERLGEGWVPHYVVAAPGSGARYYEIDLANLEKKIALEVDGGSHGTKKVRGRDARKDKYLAGLGWQVVRVRNEEVPALVGDLLAERVYGCPSPAEVVAIEQWVPSEPFVYDIDVEGEHNFYADGVVVHNCQDNNLAQKTFQEMLAREHRNIMLVGDPAQAIYSFRGSKPDYLMDFASEWPGCKTVVMNRNYRSGSAIIAAANAVIRPGKARLDVDMLAERDVEGKVRTVCSPDLDGEGEAFANWAREHHDAGGAWGDVTCLFRTNAQSRALEEALLNEKIPYVVVGGTSFYERKEVKDLLGYLRVATGRDREGDAVKRCINAPFRYLGLAFVEKVMTAAQGGVRSWPDLVRNVSQRAGIQWRQKQSAEEWANLVEDVQKRVATGTKPAELLNDIVHRTKYMDYLRKEEGEESVETSQQSNVRELCRVAERFATAAELLQYIEENLAAARRQRQDRQAGGDRVLLMSVHRSKGLEWPLVWVAGMNEKVLPHARGDEEEERRLAYVAITRARDSLVLSYVRSFATSEGVRDAQPSRFLRDAGLLPDLGETRVSLAADPEMPKEVGAPEITA